MQFNNFITWRFQSTQGLTGPIRLVLLALILYPRCFAPYLKITFPIKWSWILHEEITYWIWCYLRLLICCLTLVFDHNSIVFNLRLKISRPRQTSRIVHDFGSANWNGLRDDFSNIPWTTAFLVDDMNDVWDAWKALFMEAVEHNIPTKSLKYKRNIPWFNSELRILV